LFCYKTFDFSPLKLEENLFSDRFSTIVCGMTIRVFGTSCGGAEVESPPALGIPAGPAVTL
jgi:hypothetical protein